MHHEVTNPLEPYKITKKPLGNTLKSLEKGIPSFLKKEQHECIATDKPIIWVERGNSLLHPTMSSAWIQQRVTEEAPDYPELPVGTQLLVKQCSMSEDLIVCKLTEEDQLIRS